ncbi:hypothetical protein PFISCL1PPCAC_12816, partial [Pristionchus fissidentatus]
NNLNIYSTYGEPRYNNINITITGKIASQRSLSTTLIPSPDLSMTSISSRLESNPLEYSMRYLLRIHERKIFSWFMANFWPMQFLGPAEKGTKSYACRCST